MLLWFDPCDLYGAVADLGPGGFVVGSAADITVNSSGGRSGAGQLGISDAGQLGVAFRQSTDPALTMLVGFAFNVDVLPSVNTNPFVTLLAAGGSSEVVSLRLRSNGAIEVLKNGSSLGFSAGGLVSAASWFHLEVLVVVDAAIGQVTLKLGDSVILDLTGLDTTPAVGTEIDFVVFERAVDVGGSEIHIDDIAVWDTEAGTNGDQFVATVGDFRMAALPPSTDDNVSVSDWAKTGVGAFYEEVDDVLPASNDGDVSYVENALTLTTPAQITFGHNGVPSDLDTVLAMGMMVEAKRTQTALPAGGSTVGFVVIGDITGTRSTTTKNPIVAPAALQQSYSVVRGELGEDPSTAAAWTGPGINQAAFGLAVT